MHQQLLAEQLHQPMNGGYIRETGKIIFLVLYHIAFHFGMKLATVQYDPANEYLSLSTLLLLRAWYIDKFNFFLV